MEMLYSTGNGWQCLGAIHRQDMYPSPGLSPLAPISGSSGTIRAHFML